MNFPHSLTLIQPAATSDVYGNVIRSYSPGARTTVRGWFRLTETGEETRDGRSAALSQAVAYLKPGTAVGASWRLVAPDGAIYEVLGDGLPYVGAGGAICTRVRLRKVTG